MNKIAIVIPVYFNEPNLHKTYNELENKVLKKLPELNFDYELIFVEDGSGDDSYQILKDLKARDNKIKIIKLSRNFGSINASLAGIKNSNSDCLTLISADLQDPPELILKMLEKWQEGYKVCLATRASRHDSFFGKLFSAIFYYIFRKIALKNMPKGGFDFFLIDKKIIDIFKNSSEKNTSINGIILWSGFKSYKIEYVRQKRLAGKSRWTFAKKFTYFIDSITSFSYTPIRLVSVGGLLVAFLSFSYLLFIIFNYFYHGIEVEGWTSIVSLILMTFGIQMISIGVIGEYLWRSLDNSRNRPNYIIEEIIE